MPFIVCTNLPGCLPESDPVAVATIEEARWRAAEELAEANSIAETGCADRAFTPAERAEVDEHISNEGGTIGPLPDGYVIDVQPYWWVTLARQTDDTYRGIGDEVPPAHVQQRILDAYNNRRSAACPRRPARPHRRG